MSHTCINIWYVQVYCVLECVRKCQYDDVQVHVCNNASVCTSVRMSACVHMYYVCVKKQQPEIIAIVAEWARQDRREILARIMANRKALYTIRGLCGCVANSLTRPVLSTARNSLGTVNLVRSSCDVTSFFS